MTIGEKESLEDKIMTVETKMKKAAVLLQKLTEEKKANQLEIKKLKYLIKTQGIGGTDQASDPNDEVKKIKEKNEEIKTLKKAKDLLASRVAELESESNKNKEYIAKLTKSADTEKIMRNIQVQKLQEREAKEFSKKEAKEIGRKRLRKLVEICTGNW